MPDQNQLRHIAVRVVLVLFGVLGCAYVVCALYTAHRILFGYGSIYTAIFAGILSLPWSMLIPRSVQTPIVISIVTISAALLNSILGWFVIRRIAQRIRGGGIE